MAITEITIGKSKYKIECPQNQQENLIRLAKKVDNKAQNLISHLKHIDEKTLLALVAITLEEELESKAETISKNNSSNINTNQNQEGNLEEDTYEALSENIENVATYIEKLAKKIENY